jgi:hypothetical protein
MTPPHFSAAVYNCSSSSGEHFDRRARELRQCPSVVEGIILNANRPSEPKTENNKTPQP